MDMNANGPPSPSSDTLLPNFEKFVVIVTYGRSGSTLLQTILQGMPGAFIRGENNNALYPLFRAYKRAYNTRYNKGTAPIPSNGPWYGADEIVPRRFGQRLAAAFIQDVLNPPPEARILGFKEIRFHDTEDGEMTEFLEFIAEYFKPCKLVFNTRRASDVARSSWWKDVEMRKVLTMVETLDEVYAAYVASHQDHAFLVRYEDYTRSPDTLAPLFEFLGEAYPAEHIRSALSQQLRH
ncbi:MAG TPA: sulfotransferase [Microvirga sp.]|jgi:hypothetical protein|nr:sulfotransferase [Microvirga sp.]